MSVGALLRRFAHGHVWERLPRSFRRRLLFEATSALAPRPNPDSKEMGAPVYVAGVLRSATGLGQSARLCLAALGEAGISSHGLDLSAELMQELSLPRDEAWLARLPPGPGSLLLHVNGPLTGLALATLGRAGVRDKRIIGYWHWELTDLPPDWRKGLGLVHEVWVPTNFVADAVKRLTDKPVNVVCHPVLADPVFARPDLADRGPREKLRVLMMFDMAGFTRKNPVASVAAFRRALGERDDCELVVKVLNGGLYPPGQAALARAVEGAKNIRVVDQTLTRLDVLKLIASCDLVLSLHRSEGFGLLMAEAMILGRAAIATGWSGNVDFMSAENSALVRSKLVAVSDDQNTYHFPSLFWADADIDDAALWLARLADDEALRDKIARRGQATARALFSTESYARRVRVLLGLPDIGSGNLAT